MLNFIRRALKVLAAIAAAVGWVVLAIGVAGAAGMGKTVDPSDPVLLGYLLAPVLSLTLFITAVVREQARPTLACCLYALATIPIIIESAVLFR